MDVDEDEETQQAKAVADYGIEVDFEFLDEDEREVSCLRYTSGLSLIVSARMGRLRWVHASKKRSAS
jgi:hypothetical protein